MTQPFAVNHIKIEPVIPRALELVEWNGKPTQETLSRYIYAYLRVSTADQMQSGLGLEDQMRRIKAYVEWIILKPEYKDYRFAGIYVEEPVSSRKIWLRNREVGKVLCGRLRPGDAVVFAYHNRAFRNLQDAVDTERQWARNNIYLHMTDLTIDTRTPTGRHIFNTFISGAEWHASLISEATKAALRSKNIRGDKLGPRAKVGFRIVRYRRANGDNASKEVLDRSKLKFLRLVCYYRSVKKMKLREISDHIEELIARREGRVAYKESPREANARKQPVREWRIATCRRAWESWQRICTNGYRKQWWHHCG